MHPLQMGLPVSSRKISVLRPDQQECWSEPVEHEMASERNWIRRSQSLRGSGACSPGHEGLLPRAAPRKRATPALPAAAADWARFSKKKRKNNYVTPSIPKEKMFGLTIFVN